MEATAEVHEPPRNEELDDDARLWHSIDWSRAERSVRRLRQRIFKAAQEQDRKKVRNLQKLMLRSRANTYVSIRRVTHVSTGRRTAGVDGVKVLTPEERGRLARTLADDPASGVKPVRRVQIPKDGGKTRPLGIPTVRDRVQQCRVKNALEPEWEARFEAKSYGFRPGRSCHDAIERIFRLCARSDARRRWVLDGDLASAFDRIDHDVLMEATEGFPAQAAIRRWLKAGVMEQGRFAPTEEGTPQGGVISPLLLNIALHGMGNAIGDYDHLSKVARSKVPQLVRYADDFVVFCVSKEEAEEARGTLGKWLEGRGLTIHPEKTRIVRLEDGFDFLGFTVRKFDPKTIIKPSLKSIARVKENIRTITRENSSVRTDVFIARLNPLIKGWSTYHRSVVSSDIFTDLDSWMWTKTWKWARRRHPRKSRAWIKARYYGCFHPTRKDRWILGDLASGRYLHKFSWTKIERHIPVKGGASRDDPSLEDYWAARTRKRPHPSADGKKNVNLAARQKGLCPLCGLDLIEGAGYEPESVHEWADWFSAQYRRLNKHHLLYRSLGGSDHASNLVLIHAECHRQHHAGDRRRGFLELKPARSQ
ncbi:group II intron reverse transcriptase/maturase [Streptomyces sp. NPDC060030]|uniref:group II intron reverse transcriptase/maturase n=1 Tax=Streptomyces sp. NPDC060030 TaxID=3347042 RepID=UPI0036C6F3A7